MGAKPRNINLLKSSVVGTSQLKQHYIQMFCKFIDAKSINYTFIKWFYSRKKIINDERKLNSTEGEGSFAHDNKCLLCLVVQHMFPSSYNNKI